ncbi:MAG: chemotaxis protein CheA [Verrucomicrobiales bacterium]|nr:chemotaxis protein CheA [Verrucomicrobiales bacterium]
MACQDAPDYAALCSIIEKLALELVLAEPGKDNGLLPVNSLLGDLEEVARRMEVPEALGAAIRKGREWVDALFGAGNFEESTLSRLRSWVEWMQAAVSALHNGQAITPLIAEAAESSTATAPSAAPQAVEEVAPEEPIVLNLENDGELLREFTNESHEHLQNIELGVLTLEENPTDMATLNSIFRAFHTFKGGSGFLNLRPINRLAHELESLLDLARQQKLAIDSQVINLILSGGDTLKRFVSEMEAQLGGQGGGSPISISINDLLARVRAVVQQSQSRLTPAPVVAPTLVATPVSHAPEAGGTQEAPGGTAGHQDATPGSSGTAGAPECPPAAANAAAAGGSESPSKNGNVRVHSGATSVKVDTLKLDSLVDLVGEMVIAQSMVMQDTDLLGIQSQQLSRNLAQLGRITKELQRVAMSLRMVPIRSTFQKMTRLVRDLSVKAGKHVELHLSGEETELDRTIVEEISDPLVHMIRNAVDHGIEPAEKRMAAGKSPHGLVHLRAFHQGGNIVVEVEDDGGGLNRDRIVAKAVEKGLITSAANMSDSDVFNLIFAPGFSTAEKVTDISGRGVGMDVVRRNIEKLRGKVEIQSTLGKGSRFTIFLPLTLAIIDGMIVGIGTQRYIVPTLAVRESFRPTADMVSSVQGRSEVVNVRGRLLPLLRLHSLFGINARAADPTEGIVIVVESDRESRCVLVDDLLGKQEVVIKSLGETFKRSPALAGAAILGDGRVGLILDVDALVGQRTAPLSMAA